MSDSNKQKHTASYSKGSDDFFQALACYVMSQCESKEEISKLLSVLVSLNDCEGATD